MKSVEVNEKKKIHILCCHGVKSRKSKKKDLKKSTFLVWPTKDEAEGLA